MLCGGHSLGGVLTGAFATWDFDSNPATKADAGFNQCAGYFALDTTISTSLDDLNGSSSGFKGSPTIRDFRLTNEAVLGALMDDHSAPLAFIQTSVGFFDSAGGNGSGGAAIVDKNFPVSNSDPAQPALFGTELKAIPDEPGGPLYTWRNYDRVGAADDPVYRSASGAPFTTTAKEVTDIGELARSLSEQPLDFTEDYFPTRPVTDIQLIDDPQLAGKLVH